MYKRVNRYDSISPFSSMLFSHNIALLLRYYIHNTLDIYEIDSTPNGGRVWSFNEFIYYPKYNTYASNIDLSLTLQKNKLTGDGNTAEAVLKYIHTYSKVTGSISITPGTNSAAGSFSLSQTDDQWPLACTITDIPY